MNKNWEEEGSDSSLEEHFASGLKKQPNILPQLPEEKQPKILPEEIQFKEAKAQYERKNKIFNWTFRFIISLVIIISLIIGYFFFLLFKNPTIFEGIAKLWHVYLTSLIALTSILTSLIFLNKSTWTTPKEKETPNDLSALISELIALLKKSVDK